MVNYSCLSGDRHFKWDHPASSKGTSDHGKGPVPASIVEADVEELLHMLADAQQRVDAEMDSIVAKRDDGRHDDEFDGALLVPVADQMKIGKASSLPQEIIDLTLLAAKNGAKGTKALYELIVAEMDVGVARFYVTWNSVYTESGWKKAPAWLVRYLAEQHIIAQPREEA
jgi:hypothetical protein